MDTGSHLLFGCTLAGLAMIDPAVSDSISLSQAVLLGTLIGSHAPDFDAAARIKGSDTYIRVHRGITHSLPALLIWPLLIMLPLMWLFHLSAIEGFHLYGWACAAVIFHVILDLFNVYGVQCFRPFTKRWLHLDVLSLFDPFLFVLHVAGLLSWFGTDASPGLVFSTLYGITFLYIALRVIHHRHVVRLVQRVIGEQGICHVIPSLNWFHWQFVMETKQQFLTGFVRFNFVQLCDTYSKQEENPIIQASMHTDGVRSFLHFAQRVHVSWRSNQDGYEVIWSDMRFWHNSKLPFGVSVELDHNLNVIDYKLGWRKKSWEAPYV